MSVSCHKLVLGVSFFSTVMTLFLWDGYADVWSRHSVTYSWGYGQFFSSTSSTTGACGLSDMSDFISTGPLAVPDADMDEIARLVEGVAVCTRASNVKTVIVTVVDVGFSDMIDTFVHFLINKSKLRNILFVTLDERTHRALLKRHLASYFTNELGKLGLSHSALNSVGWKRKGHLKFKIATIIVNLGYSVLLSDMDVTYFKNPFGYMKCRHCDIELQRDFDTKNSSFNAGLIFFKATENTRRFLNEFHTHLFYHSDSWDQSQLNKQLPLARRKYNLTYEGLPFAQFITARVVKEDDSLYYDPIDAILNRTVAMHHLYLAYPGKVHRMKEFGLWMNDKGRYYTDPDRRYISYDNPLPNLATLQWAALQNAFKLAKVLNRTLILPKFACLKQRLCKAVHYVASGDSSRCHCSIIHVLQDVKRSMAQTLFNHFAYQRKGLYRERTFLSHPLVPASVKQSLSPLFTIKTDVSQFHTRDLSLAPDDSLIFTPENCSIGPSAGEIRKWFAPYSKISVIRLRFLYGTFSQL